MNTTLSVPSASPGRVMSLDVFRGITLAGMILVNNPATWEHVYAPLRHAPWNGWTPTDLVFPSFLFIVGAAISFAFDRRRELGQPRGLLFVHAARRAVILFALGLLYSAFTNHQFVNGFTGHDPHWQVIVPYALVVLALAFLWPGEQAIAERGWGRHAARLFVAVCVLLGGVFAFAWYFDLFEASHQRVPGVLQRIAVCYLIASAIVLLFGVKGRVFWAAACLIGYWAILRYVSPPAGFQPRLEGPDGRLHDWIDMHLLGAHLYQNRPDPEGLLSTIPAIATTLLGVLAGDWLRSSRDSERKAAGLLLAGLLIALAGLILNRWIPINKKIWTPSYVLLAGGLSMYALGLCYLVVDLQGWRRWAAPFMVLGTNTIVIYLLSSMAGYLLAVKWPLEDGGTFVVKERVHAWMLDHVRWLSPQGASLAFAIGFLLVWILLFAPLYRRRVFVRV